MERKKQAEQPTKNLHFLLIGVICGFYPLMFYYSNNFFEINTWKHLGAFGLLFLGIPVVVFSVFALGFKKSSFLKSQRNLILFVAIIMTVASLMSWAMFLTLKKKMLLALLIIASAAGLKLKDHYQKLLVLVLIMSAIPVVKNLGHLIDSQRNMAWTQLPDGIENAVFKKFPNIYMIQPDGYVSRKIMSDTLYNFDNPFYDWLEENDFTLYDDFRSNYPASLTSNSSLFAMKQHGFGKTFFPKFEMPHAREIISGNSNALKILKKNGYTTFFIVTDEYFQQNFPETGFDYYNISPEEIPIFSNGSKIKKSVFDDLKAAIDTVQTSGPKFFFVEKLLPHHVNFTGTKEEDRISYLSKIEEVNDWLKKTVNYITEKDPSGIIILMADHGGWVGLNSYPEMFSTTDETYLNSIYSSLAAIKWNGNLKEGMDSEMKTTVNFFRILFSVLSENPEYLKHLEPNSGYNLYPGFFSNTVREVFDNRGKVVVK